MISGNTRLMFNPKNHPSLGNILFLSSAVLALAWDNNTDATFPSLKNDYDYWGDDHKKTILRNLSIESIQIKNQYMGHTNIDVFLYEQLPYSDGLEITGYFLSYKYFHKYRDRILKTFEIDENTKSYINKKYDNLLNENTISVHIRRGDFSKDKKDICYRLSHIYYKNAINFILTKISNPTFVLFMEHNDDKVWCKKYIISEFPNNKFTIINGEKDYVDIYLMSLCKYNIIANSTFSWWGAYLNKNQNIIIYPKNWLDKKYEDDLYPKEWCGIIME